MKRWIRRYRKEFAGKVSTKYVDITDAIPIGKNIRKNRYEDFLNYSGEISQIGVVKVNGYTFIIDGRNRARANLDNGLCKLPAEVFSSNSKQLEEKLFSISNYFLDEIPISKTAKR